MDDITRKKENTKKKTRRPKCIVNFENNIERIST